MSDRELRPVGRFEWEQIIKRARLDGIIGGKAGRVEGKGGRGGVSGATVKAVALALASYADGDTGRNVRPGDTTVAVEVETTLRTVKLVKAKLIALGLLRRTRAGARRQGDPDTYQLTLPTDLLDVVEVLTPAQVRVAAKKMAETNRGKQKVSSGSRMEGESGESDDSMRDPEDTTRTVDNSAVRGPEDTTQDDTTDVHEVSSGPANDVHEVSSGPSMRDPEDPPTNHDQPQDLTNHSDGDVRTAVTGPRARDAPDEDPDSDVADEEPEPAPSPPRKCPAHGLAAGHREDGRPRCALCRVTEDQAAGRRRPQGIPYRDLATVTHIHTRSA